MISRLKEADMAPEYIDALKSLIGIAPYYSSIQILYKLIFH